ncbi:asparagine synthetase [Alternaria alternata]|nr:asparagine synthetase [Alternaria alternata]
MLHLWVNECDAANKVANTSADEQERWHTHLIMKFKNKTYKLRLPISKLLPHLTWETRTTVITLDLEDQRAPELGRRPETGSEQSKPPDLRSASIEFDHGSDTFYMYHRTPKKLSKLKSDPTGVNTPVAWAIWIDEDFSVPWYLILVLILIIIATCVFAPFYGWPIGSYIIAATGLAMTGWILWAKDSKHPRL